MNNTNFSNRFRDHNTLLGTFQKFPSYIATEIIGLSQIDYVVLDCEHAPFTMAEIDNCILAAAAYQLPLLVRVPRHDSRLVSNVLDMGAAGIIVPHVSNAEIANDIVAKTHYKKHNGQRGFSGSPRSGLYGNSDMASIINQADNQTIVICQIEDVHGVNSIEDILSVNGVDGILIGPADLSLSYAQNKISNKTVAQDILNISNHCKKHSMPVGIALADASKVKEYLDQGFSFFVIGSDQSNLKKSLLDLASSIR